MNPLEGKISSQPASCAARESISRQRLPFRAVRTVLLCRDGADQRHLATALAAAGRIDAIVIETRGDARRKKLARVFRRTRWWQVPRRALDVTLLVAYGNWCEKALVSGLGATGYPDGVPRFEVGNPNDPESVEVLRRLDPDVLLVLGTSILRREVLAIPNRDALNLHGGGLPDFRGVYSDFWALVNDRPDRVGSVIFHLDPGIDTGEIAVEEMLELGRSTSLRDLKVANSRLRVKLTLQALDQVQAGTLPRIAQPAAGARNWGSPTGLQLVRGLVHIRRARRRRTRP
jgi:methionyl-tRNA formyltransferase